MAHVRRLHRHRQPPGVDGARWPACVLVVAAAVHRLARAGGAGRRLPAGVPARPALPGRAHPRAGRRRAPARAGDRRWASVAAGVRVRNIAAHGLLPTMLELPVGSMVHRYAVPRLGPDETHEETLHDPHRAPRRDPGRPGHHATRRPAGDAARATSSGPTSSRSWCVRRWCRWTPSAPACSATSRACSTDAVSQSDLAFHALREYVPGDDLRHVHWRSSAKAMAASPTTPGCSSASTSTPAAATSPWSSTTRLRCWADAARLRDRDVGRGVDPRPRDPRRVRHVVRLRDQCLLRRDRPPRPRLRLPGRPRHAPAWSSSAHRAAVVLARHQPALPGRWGGDATSRTSSGRSRPSRPRYAATP